MTAPKTKGFSGDIVSDAGTVKVEFMDVDGVEHFTITGTLTGSNLSGSQKSIVKAGTGGFQYMDGLGVSLNIVENVKKGRVRAS
jgi:hypothetical protein